MEEEEEEVVVVEWCSSGKGVPGSSRKGLLVRRSLLRRMARRTCSVWSRRTWSCCISTRVEASANSCSRSLGCANANENSSELRCHCLSSSRNRSPVSAVPCCRCVSSACATICLIKSSTAASSSPSTYPCASISVACTRSLRNRSGPSLGCVCPSSWLNRNSPEKPASTRFPFWLARWEEPFELEESEEAELSDWASRCERMRTTYSAARLRIGSTSPRENLGSAYPFTNRGFFQNEP